MDKIILSTKVLSKLLSKLEVKDEYTINVNAPYYFSIDGVEGDCYTKSSFTFEADRKQLRQLETIVSSLSEQPITLYFDGSYIGLEGILII